MRRFLIIFITFIISLLLACSPQKRLNRIVSKHPELAASSKTVTVTIQDTIYIPAVQDTVHIHDTVYLQAKPGDVIAEATAGFTKATLTKTNNGIDLAVEQLPDSIPITASANVDVPEVNVKTSKSTYILGITFIIVILIVSIIKILK